MPGNKHMGLGPPKPIADVLGDYTRGQRRLPRFGTMGANQRNGDRVVQMFIDKPAEATSRP
jgi:hypothetical protein